MLVSCTHSDVVMYENDPRDEQKTTKEPSEMSYFWRVCRSDINRFVVCMRILSHVICISQTWPYDFTYAMKFIPPAHLQIVYYSIVKPEKKVILWGVGGAVLLKQWRGMHQTVMLAKSESFWSLCVEAY